MMLSVSATRYANALAEVVLSPGSGLEPRDVLVQLRRVEELLAQSDELRHVMYSPAVRSSKKRAAMAHFANDLALAPKIRNFIFVLIDHRRFAQLPAIREAFEQAVDERTGFVRADVVSAQALDDGQRNVLEAELNRLTGKRVRMQFATDEALIGGVVARIGSTIYDGSVRGKLDALRRRLSAEA